MLNYKQVVEIGAKGERLGFWRMAYPAVIEGHLGLMAGDFILAAELESLPNIAPIVTEIRRRDDKDLRG